MNILARGLIGLLTKTGKKFDPFFDPPGDVFGQKGGQRCKLAWVFGSNVSLALSIDPWTWLVFALKDKNLPLEKRKHIWAKIGQN